MIDFHTRITDGIMFMAFPTSQLGNLASTPEVMSESRRDHRHQGQGGEERALLAHLAKLAEEAEPSTVTQLQAGEKCLQVWCTPYIIVSKCVFCTHSVSKYLIPPTCTLSM